MERRPLTIGEMPPVDKQRADEEAILTEAQKTQELPALRMLVIDEQLLSEDTKLAIRARALKQADKERAEKAEETYYEAALDAARRSFEPQEQLEYIMLDLAGHSDRFMIDGVVFLHGLTYQVRKSQADYMREMMQRGWEHEDEVGGANRGSYRRPRNLTLGPGDAARSAQQIMGAR